MKFDSIENIQKISGITPMPIIDLVCENGTIQSKPADKLGKSELEQMLSLLDYSKLEAINIGCRKDGYPDGCRPLLHYSKEALAKYASLIYRNILPYFDTMTLTEAEYIALWLAPYTQLQAQLKAKEAGFISTLETIVSTPISNLNPFIIVTPQECLYTQIADFLDGKDFDLFKDNVDFLYSNFSPLRKSYVTDPRALALVTEVEAMRDACNKELDAFIGKELETYAQPVQELLAYYNLRPKNVAMLIASKAQIPQSDWEEILQALENKVITENTRKLITSTLKALRQAQKAKKAKTSLGPKPDPSIKVDANDLFIRDFVQQLASAYAMPVIKKPEDITKEDILDDLFGTIDVLTLAHIQGTSPETVQDQQKSSEKWYSNFNNIAQSLVACLEISLNNLSSETVLSDEALSHGAIKAMLAFAKTLRLKVLYKLNANILDYTTLAQELRHNIQFHTNYFTDAEPLPEVSPISKVQLIDDANKATPILPSLFDLTPPIQEVLDSIKANTVTTGVIEVLSETDVQSLATVLMPVTDYTIKEIANMLTGQASIPYIADGDLIIHITTTGQYLKVVPTIRDDGYAEYQFKSYNWVTLNGHIHSLQKLLAKTPEYIKWRTEPEPILESEQGYNPLPKDYSYKLLPKGVELRKTAINEALELYEYLLNMANIAIDAEDETALKDIRKITSTHYYKDFIRLVGHRLASWVYEPEDYRLISSPPIDANGYEIDYEPNHLNGIRHDNRHKNLKIELKQTNLDLRSTSRPVTYNGQTFPTLKKYCAAFDISYDLRSGLGTLQPGETKEYSNSGSNRAYSLGADEWQYIATDVKAKASVYSYNGMPYPDLKAFAKAMKLNYDNIQKGLSRARNKGKAEYKYNEKSKIYTFYLDDCGNVTKIL